MWIIKLNIFWGDLSGSSAKTATLVTLPGHFIYLYYLQDHSVPKNALCNVENNNTAGDTVVATASWDKTVRLWDVYTGERTATDILQHSHEVLALTYAPSGRTLAASTLNGEVAFWDAPDALLLGTIEARRDLRGGRLMSDRRASGNMDSGQAFTSIAYSADGSFLIAGGTSKWVCVYDVAEKVLLRRFQLSKNYALDGVLDQLNSKHVTDAGPLDQLDDEDEKEILPPTAVGGAGGVDKLPGMVLLAFASRL